MNDDTNWFAVIFTSATVAILTRLFFNAFIF